MNTILSRRKIADTIAKRYSDGESLDKLLHELAAYLVESRQTRSYRLVVRAVEDALMRQGIVVASVTSAHELTEEQRKSIAQMFPGSKVHLRESLDPSVIGGLRLSAPGMVLDSTIQRKLTALKRAKI